MLKSIVSLTLMAAFALVGAVATPAGVNADVSPSLTVDRVLVNRTGGVYVEGKVDCAASVEQMWPGGAPDGTTVLVNVDADVHQRAGRAVVSVHMGDSQASPCWTNTTVDVDPGRCAPAGHPCMWNTANWGDSGYLYGSGAFKTGVVHVDATLRNGFWGPDLQTDTFDFWQVFPFDLKAARK